MSSGVYADLNSIIVDREIVFEKPLAKENNSQNMFERNVRGKIVMNENMFANEDSVPLTTCYRI